MLRTQDKIIQRSISRGVKAREQTERRRPKEEVAGCMLQTLLLPLMFRFGFIGFEREI